MGIRRPLPLIWSATLPNISGISSCFTMPNGTTGANWKQTIRTGQRSVDRHVFETDPDLGSNVLAVLHRIGQQSGPDFAKRLQLKRAGSTIWIWEAEPGRTRLPFARPIRS